MGRVAYVGSLGEWSGTSFHSESQRAYEATTNWGDETIDLDFSDDLSVGTVSSQFVRKEGGKKSQVSASAMLGEAEPGC